MDPSGLSNGSSEWPVIRTRRLRLSRQAARAALYQMSYGPIECKNLSGLVYRMSLVIFSRLYTFSLVFLMKKNGGDPAAGSPTATL